MAFRVEVHLTSRPPLLMVRLRLTPTTLTSGTIGRTIIRPPLGCGGNAGVSIDATKYYAICHDGIPPSWRTDTINVNSNLNLEGIKVKSDANLFSDITDVPIELILCTAIPERDNKAAETGHIVRKEIVLGTLDPSKMSSSYFLGTYQKDGRSTACYIFRANSEFYLGTQQDALGAVGWCVVVKPEHTMPVGKSMDMSFEWSFNCAGSSGG